MEKIPVIASFDTKGNVVPLYIKYMGENLKIIQAVKLNSNINLMEYKIQVSDGRIQRETRLSYLANEKVWMLNTDF